MRFFLSCRKMFKIGIARKALEKKDLKEGAWNEATDIIPE